MPSTGAPAADAILTASIVSAVSPDCDIAIVKRARVEHAVAVTEFAGQFHLDGQLAQRAQQIHADHAGVERGPAAGNRNLRDRAQHVFVDVQLGGELRIA